MFSSIFDWIILSSVMGSILVLLILAVKFALKNTLGANWHYYIWFLLLLRLIIPFTPESMASMYNFFNINSFGGVISKNNDSSFSMHNLERQLSDSSNTKSDNINLNLLPLNSQQSNIDTNETSVANIKFSSWKANLIIFWLTGVILLASYTIFINLKLRNRIKAEPLMNIASISELFATCKSEMKVSNNIPILSTNVIHTPALFGLINPVMLIPNNCIKNLTISELRYIILHELAHMRRKDLIINWITVVIQTLHWFNPIIWYGFYRMHQDCELACDGLVLSSLEPEEYKEYGHTIIRVLEISHIPQWIPGAAGILLQKSNIKRRIHMISNFKKGSLAISLISVIIFTAIGIIGCTNPQGTINTQQAMDKDPNSYNQILQDLKNSQMLAGTVEVEGQGLVITLTDSEPGFNTSPENAPAALVHDADIINLINQLTAAGAEAISVNDERLIASSAIDCRGTTLLINGNSHISPFVIKAIGNSEKMADLLGSKTGYAAQLRLFGLDVSIEEAEYLSIPEYKGEITFQYAKPVENI